MKESHLQHLIEMDNGSTSTASDRELCLPCADRGLRADAIADVYVVGPDAGNAADYLTSLCRNCLYVLTARRMGWPVRGCDMGGYPNDPEHPWNA